MWCGEYGDPFVNRYLAVFATGSYSSPFNSKKFSCADYDERMALLVGNIGALVRSFGVEFVLMWTAVLLKKRVIVLGTELGELQLTVRTLPALAWHRQNWGLMHPLVNLEESEVAGLKESGVYVAGCLDPAVKGREDLYDVLVDCKCS